MGYNLFKILTLFPAIVFQNQNQFHSPSEEEPIPDVVNKWNDDKIFSEQCLAATANGFYWFCCTETLLLEQS